MPKLERDGEETQNEVLLFLKGKVIPVFEQPVLDVDVIDVSVAVACEEQSMVQLSTGTP